MHDVLPKAKNNVKTEVTSSIVMLIRLPFRHRGNYTDIWTFTKGSLLKHVFTKSISVRLSSKTLLIMATLMCSNHNIRRLQPVKNSFSQCQALTICSECVS